MTTRTKQETERRFIDATGHMDPDHSSRLLDISRRQAPASVRPFFDADTVPEGSEDDLPEALAEQSVLTMTSGEQQPISVISVDELLELSFHLEEAEVYSDTDDVPETESSPRKRR